MNPHKVLCCGGRNFSDYNFVCLCLARLREVLGDFAIIHGGAKGADSLCGTWGKSQGLPVIVVEANWNIHDKGAGSIRNKWMLDYCEPTYVVAFSGGVGTQDMIRKSKAANLTVWECRP
jgi:hypothetical protein